MRIALPLDKILQLSTGEAAIENIFDFVFFFAIDDDWFWRRWCLSIDRVTLPWGEAVNVVQRKKMIVAIGSTANRVKTAQHNLLIDIEGPLSSYHASQVCLQLILPLCLRDDFLLQWDVRSNAV